VDKAYNNNLDTRIAYERVIEARSNLGLVRAERAPTLSTVNEYEYSLRSQNAQPFAGANAQSPFDLFDAGLDASWQIDLFGGIQRSICQMSPAVTCESACCKTNWNLQHRVLQFKNKRPAWSINEKKQACQTSWILSKLARYNDELWPYDLT